MWALRAQAGVRARPCRQPGAPHTVPHPQVRSPAGRLEHSGPEAESRGSRSWHGFRSGQCRAAWGRWPRCPATSRVPVSAAGSGRWVPGAAASAAAAQEDEVPHRRDGGAGVLPGDQVAVQHHVHGVGLAGCGDGAQLGRRPRSHPPPGLSSGGPAPGSPLKQAPASFAKSSTTSGSRAKPGARTSSSTGGCGAAVSQLGPTGSLRGRGALPGGEGEAWAGSRVAVPRSDCGGTCPGRSLGAKPAPGDPAGAEPSGQKAPPLASRPAHTHPPPRAGCGPASRPAHRHTHPGQAVAPEGPGPVVAGGTAERRDAVADRTDGLWEGRGL